MVRRNEVPTSTDTARLGSAAAEAALAQYLTGPGSGPYSGTPFRPAPGAAADDAGTKAPGEPRDHNIIDHSRHVSSVGRR